jgi:acetyl esterase/lipase
VKFSPILLALALFFLACGTPPIAPSTGVRAVSSALVAMGGACTTSADCNGGLYCETSPGWALSVTGPNLANTCQSVSTAAIATVTSGSLPAFASATGYVVPYLTTGMACTVYQPSTGTGIPVVVYFSYSGFGTSNVATQDVVDYMHAIVTTGKVAVACNVPAATATVGGVPAELSAVRCAVRTWGTSAGGTAFTTATGQAYRGNPSRLGAVGSSAGGSLLALELETQDQDVIAIGGSTTPINDGSCLVAPLAGGEVGLVKRAVLAAPPSDFAGVTGYGSAAHPTKVSSLSNYAGTSVEPGRSDALNAVSPAVVGARCNGMPPTLIVGSIADTVVDPPQLTSLQTTFAAHCGKVSRIQTAALFRGTIPVDHPFSLTLATAPAGDANRTAHGLLNQL